VNLKNVSSLVLFGLLLLCACSPIRHPDSQVVIMQTEAPRSMDPADHTATYTTAVLDPMYEALTQFDQNLQIRPSLATSWVANSSGSVWTVKIRSGVFFHDGAPLNARAVAASFNRLLDARRGLAGAGVFRRAVAAVTVIDDQTVRFHLRRPSASFPGLLAIEKIVSPAEDRLEDLGRKAVGTGPYRFSEWKTGEYVLETRNENYWGPKPRYGQLKWIWSSEPALMNMALLAGEVDLVNPLPPMFADALQHDRRIALLKGESSAVFWIALDTKAKPLDDMRVRQALNYATDRKSLIASQLRGYGIPAASPLAPADADFDPEVRGYKYDAEKAKTLLKAAGYPGGFTLNIAVQESQSNIIQAVAGMWAGIGVTLNIHQMETGVFAQTIFGDEQQKAAAGIQCVFASWTSPNLDPESQLGPLYRTQSWSPAAANLGFYGNEKVDRLLDQAAAELDAGKRRRLYSEAQQIISDDAPHVLLYYARDLAAQRVRLKDFWLFPGGQVELASSIQ
jgi:glutathione transport system substrate-binding protein